MELRVPDGNRVQTVKHEAARLVIMRIMTTLARRLDLTRWLT